MNYAEFVFIESAIKQAVEVLERIEEQNKTIIKLLSKKEEV